MTSAVDLTIDYIGTGMPQILNLPQEIHERIFSHLIIPPMISWHHIGPAYRSPFLVCAIARLRLVCRPWADWLYEHHLYRTSSFHNASKSMAFIDYQNRRSKVLTRAKCQYLEVDFLWNREDPPQAPHQISSEILEKLLQIFSDSIVTLDLKFADSFTLPCQTIKAIGRIKNLRDLRLDIARWPSRDLNFVDANHGCFHSLMMEAHGLKSLKLWSPVSLPCKPDVMAEARYPAITHLKVHIDRLDPDVLLGISIAIKASLKLLSLEDHEGCENLNTV
jgi:hypothetical protein